MSCTETATCDAADNVQEFTFDGVYAGTIPQRNEDVRAVKRQPKRRGLWYACFAKPRVDETAEAFPTRSTASRLRLSTRQLEYRRTGSPDARQLPLSDIHDVQYKWVEAGGVRVSKVTISLGSAKAPVVIRGLKNPEDLVNAVKNRQFAAVGYGEKFPHENDGRSNANGGAAKSGRSDVGAASVKHSTPRALFADATGSPGSAATSGCGSMTLLSAFARTPAQDFAGADSVAREIQLASPRLEDSSYTSSETSDTMDVALVKAAGARSGAFSSLMAPRATHVEKAAIEAIQAAGPPQQPTDSSVLQASVVLPDDKTSSRASSLPPLPPHGAAITIPDNRHPALTLIRQPSSRGPLQPSPVGIPLSLGHLPSRIASGCSRDVVVLQGGSPPQRAEDSMVEGGSESASVQGSTHVESMLASCTCPSATPADTVVHANNETPQSAQDSKLTAEDGNFILETALLPGLHTTHAVDGSKAAHLQSASALTAISGGASYEGFTSHPETGTRLEKASLTLQVRDHSCSILRDQSLALPLPGPGLGSSSSSAQTPRLLPSLPEQHQQQLENRHRSSHSSLQPTLQPNSARGSASDRVLVGPNRRLDGDCSSYKTASSGGLAYGSAGTSLALSQLEAALARSGDAPIAALPVSGPISNANENDLPKSVGTLGIAAAVATISAVLTSASLAGAASMTACPVATASAAAPPLSLSLLGMTAAAAVTLVAAAAVTHIRTGSPLCPLDSPGPYDGNALEKKTLVLSARSRDASSRSIEDPHEPLLVGRNALDIFKATSEVKSERTNCPVAAQPQVAVVNELLGAGGSADEGDEPSFTTAAPVPGAASTRAAPTAGPASRSSWCGSHGAAGPCAPGNTSASGGATGASGVSAGCGDSSEDAVISGAWGSQPALADLDPEQGTHAGKTAVQWLGLNKDQDSQSEAEDQPLREILFSKESGAMPTLVRSPKTGTCPLRSSERQGGVEELSTGLYAYSRVPSIEQSSCMDSAACHVSSVARAPAGRDLTYHQQQQKTETVAACDYRLHSPFQCAELALSVATVCTVESSPVVQDSQTSRRPREMHLTESPVRMLYSVHTSDMGLQAQEHPVHPSKWGTMLPTPASGLPLQRTCDSAAQTDSPPVECAMQTKDKSGSSFRGPGPNDGVMDNPLSRIASRLDSGSCSAPSVPLRSDAVQPVCKRTSSVEYGEAPGTVAAAAGERSTDDIFLSHASVHDLSLTDGEDPHLGGSKMAVGVVVDARRGPFESFPGQESSTDICACSSTLPGIPCAKPSTGDDMAADLDFVLPSCSLPCAALPTYDSKVNRITPVTDEEKAPLLGHCLVDNQLGFAAVLTTTIGACANGDLRPAASQQWSITSTAANPVMVPTAGRPDPAVDSQWSDHRVRQQGVHPCALINTQVASASLSRSGSESHLLSPSVSGTSDSVLPSASVGSGDYTRLSSAVSNADGLDPVVGTHNTRLLVGSTGTSLRNSYCAEAAQTRGQSCFPLRECIHIGAAQSSGLVDIEHGLVGPTQVDRKCYMDFSAPGGFSRPCGSNAQEDIHGKVLEFSTVAVDPSSLMNAGSDTVDDMMWLLGPAGGPWCSDATAADSAPDSPRIPLPPPLATSRSGFGSSRRTTVEAVGSVKEKVEGCHSRASSSSSHRVAADSLAELEDRQRISGCSSVRYKGAQHSGQADQCLDHNSPKEPLSLMDCGPAPDCRAPGKGPEYLLSALPGNVTSNSNSKARVSNAGRSVRDPSTGFLCAASDDGYDDGTTNSTPQTRSSMPPSDGSAASGAPPATPISPDLSDVSSSAYIGGVYPYVGPHRLQAPSVTHVEPGARLAGPVAASRDDLFHNPLYNAPSKDSADSGGPRRSQLHSEGGGSDIRLPEMAYSLRGSGNGRGGNEDGCDTSTCGSSTVPASASHLSVGTASIGRRRTREDSATSSYWRDDVGSTSNATRDQGTSAQGDWRLWVTAAAIKSLANSGRVCSPQHTAVSSGSREWDIIGHNSSSAYHQPPKRARTVHSQSIAPSSAALQSQQQPLVQQQQVQMSGLLRGLASPMMVLNPAYVQSVAGSPALQSPQHSTGDLASVPPMETKRNRVRMSVNMSSGDTLQQLHTPSIPTPRSQEPQQQYKGPPLRIGVFSSSRMVYPPHAQSGGSPAVTTSPLSVSNGASAAITERHRKVGEPELHTPTGARVQEQEQQHTDTATRLSIIDTLNRVLHLARTQSSPASSALAATSIPPATAASVSTAEASQIGGNRDTKADAIYIGGEGLRAELVLVQEPQGADADLEECYGEVSRHDSQQTTPKRHDIGQLQEADWNSIQGSPSSQQAAHAAALLRRANDAVDFAREAVKRGDAEWLSRVTATLQAVQSALDALREF